MRKPFWRDSEEYWIRECSWDCNVLTLYNVDIKGVGNVYTH